MTERFGQTPVRPDWLARYTEPPIDPRVPIIDAHHHLFDRPGNRYGVPELTADLASGHNVTATVIVQANAFYRTTGPVALAPVGETEQAAQVAHAVTYGPDLCAAIVGYADLMLGAEVRPVLEAHLAAGQGRFRGIRHILAWDSDPRQINPAYPTTEDMMESPTFLAGFAELAPLGLSFDAWIYFHQIPRLTALARRFPETPIVLNHCGGIMGRGTYADRRDSVFRPWRQAMSDLATCPNVSVKIGGLGMALSGFGFAAPQMPPASHDLAMAWEPWVHSCIDIFGPDRDMFESNFPVDKGSCSYVVLWNAYKRLIAGASPGDAHALLCGTAQRFYRIADGLAADGPTTPTHGDLT